MRIRLALAAALAAVSSGCAGAPPRPVEIDTRNDACEGCRMAISDRRFAAQVVAPGEEPRLFDDVGCLREWLAGTRDLAPGAVAYVADHRTGSWVEARRAVFTKVPGLASPMDSGLLAHQDAASRAADPDAVGGTPRGAEDVFGAGPLPGGAP
jgi:copper chaperone NosL